MTDFELNRSIAELVLPCDYHLNVEQQTVDLVGVITKLGGHGIPCEVVEKYGEFSPCSSWNDLMPLVVEHRIEYIKIASMFVVSAGFGEFESKSKNLQRALAECLLKILTNES